MNKPNLVTLSTRNGHKKAQKTQKPLVCISENDTAQQFAT